MQSVSEFGGSKVRGLCGGLFDFEVGFTERARQTTNKDRQT